MYFINCAAAVLGLLALPSAATASPAQPLSLNLHVADMARSELVLFDQPLYGEEALDSLFTRARDEGDTYCQMVRNVRFNGAAWDDAAAARWLLPDRMKLFSSVATCDSCAEVVRAGCRNFYIMNDKEPDRDFKLVGHLYPDTAYDCYGVGLVQPYMMHNVLTCRGLSPIDFDWRILDAHYQILQQYRTGSMTTAEGLDAGLANVQIAWTAQIDHPKPTHPATLASFCTGRRAALCTEHMVRFGTTHQTLKRVQLDLAPLHQMTFMPVEDVLPVVFLSNAIQPGYTSQKQFKELMLNAEQALDPGEKVVFIHHVGVRRTFGIYELSRNETGHTLKTVCKDPYELVMPGHTDEFYDTWFEQATSTKSGFPTCQALLAKIE